MKKMKKLVVMLVCVMAIGLLGGCGKSFDATGYTKALLDNSYKNDSTAFVDMKIGTAEEAADLYEQGLDKEVEAMLASEEITEEQAEQFREVIADILAGAKYTVGEAEKQDDGSYVVTITYEQMNVFAPAMEAYVTKVTEMATEWYAAEEVPSEEEMYDQIILALKDCLVDTLANVTYDEPATATLRIELIDKVYTPNESDLVNLESVFFDIDEMNNVSMQ